MDDNNTGSKLQLYTYIPSKSVSARAENHWLSLTSGEFNCRVRKVGKVEAQKEPPCRHKIGIPSKPYYSNFWWANKEFKLELLGIKTEQWRQWVKQREWWLSKRRAARYVAPTNPYNNFWRTNRSILESSPKLNCEEKEIKQGNDHPGTDQHEDYLYLPSRMHT